MHTTPVDYLCFHVHDSFVCACLVRGFRYVPKYKPVAVVRGTPFWDEILEEAKSSDGVEAEKEL